ncbi:MAG: amidohydrolase, partial [Lentisphaeria bacterium]|nr:amidohydrolase [Lentisphaeria bacterium]
MLPETIRQEFAAIHQISNFIHQNPELGFKEFKASAALKKFLADRGFSIRENLGGVETAFLAECASPGADRKIPLFAFLGEYDALAGLGHACGHNLIAAAS